MKLLGQSTDIKEGEHYGFFKSYFFSKLYSRITNNPFLIIFFYHQSDTSHKFIAKYHSTKPEVIFGVFTTLKIARKAIQLLLVRLHQNEFEETDS